MALRAGAGSCAAAPPRPFSARLARCRASPRRSADRTDSSHSTVTAATALLAPGRSPFAWKTDHPLEMKGRSVLDRTHISTAPLVNEHYDRFVGVKNRE